VNRLPRYFENLIEAFQKLPGVGPKTAYRFAFYLLKAEKEEAENLARAILELKEKVRLCRICLNLSDDELCPVCSDATRDKQIICVVEQPQDALAIERAGEYKGTYHILGGSLAPAEGIGPEKLRIDELLQRVDEGNVREVIIATNPNVRGEMTAAYLIRILKGRVEKITQLATGIPFGGDLDFADEITITRALRSRREIEE
jgi:recombination protein RecR